MLSLLYLKNALHRTLLGLLPALAKADDDFARDLLEPSEYALYLRMDARDRHHACAVTKALLKDYPDASSALLRAALLHDVGKSGEVFSAPLRVLVHFYTPHKVPPQPRLKGLKGAWQLKRHHDRYGARMIREAGGGKRVAEIVARHHHPGRDSEAAILKAIDERY